VTAVIAVLIAIFFRESPPTPPSPSAATANTDFKESIWIIVKDVKFLSLAFAFGTVNGTFNVYGSLIDDLLDCYGLSPDQVSYLGVVMIVTGILSAMLFGIYV
jgi:hypothetical protein